MTEKFEFSTADFEAFNIYLSSLLDADVALSAAALAADLKTWLNNYFELSPAQQADLNNLPESLIHFLASQGSIALANRLPIFLIKPLSSGLRGSKLIKPKANIEMEVEADNSYSYNGDLTIDISY